MRRIAAGVKNYRDVEYASMAGKKALRFIDDNFRKQSWEGIPWKRRKGGKRNIGRALLIDKGTLRRGTNFKASTGQVMVYNYVKYAKAHNNGFTGIVAVKAHNRRLFGKFKQSSVATHKSSSKRLEKGTTHVKAFNRNMRLPRRQFMPTADRPSPTLNNDIKREVTLKMLKILKS